MSLVDPSLGAVMLLENSGKIREMLTKIPQAD